MYSVSQLAFCFGVFLIYFAWFLALRIFNWYIQVYSLRKQKHLEKQYVITAFENRSPSLTGVAIYNRLSQDKDQSLNRSEKKHVQKCHVQIEEDIYKMCFLRWNNNGESKTDEKRASQVGLKMGRMLLLHSCCKIVMLFCRTGCTSMCILEFEEETHNLFTVIVWLFFFLLQLK